MRVLIMLAGDSTGSGWDYRFEYVATSERIQWCKLNFCLLNCIFVEFGEIDIWFSRIPASVYDHISILWLRLTMGRNGKK